jgi:alpha-L-fucosidase
MARSTADNGEAIYGTRPWTVAAEGPSTVVVDHFKEDPVSWTVEDFRFTQKGQVVYAFLMKWPEGGRTVIRSLGRTAGRVVQVEMLGVADPLPFEQDDRGLALTLPPDRPTEYTQCLKVTLNAAR